MQDRESEKPEFRRSAELQSQMDRIGGRFLDRVLADFDAMEKALALFGAGDATAAGTLEMFAHRIHGSSAIFGFAALSDAAGALETLLASGQTRGDPAGAAPEVAAGVAAVRAAAQAARAGSAAV
jgi:HPt (histidine-containing phosphotransfer) domain-containing protein